MHDLIRDPQRSLDRNREPQADIFAGLRQIEELTPTTSPSALVSGPPELPGLIAASVWIMSRYRPVWSPPGRMLRPVALTTPAVTVGLAIAQQVSEWIAQRDDPLANHQILGAPGRNRGQPLAIDLDDGDVSQRIFAQ